MIKNDQENEKEEKKEKKEGRKGIKRIKITLMESIKYVEIEFVTYRHEKIQISPIYMYQMYTYRFFLIIC